MGYSEEKEGDTKERDTDDSDIRGGDDLANVNTTAGNTRAYFKR